MRWVRVVSFWMLFAQFPDGYDGMCSMDIYLYLICCSISVKEPMEGQRVCPLLSVKSLATFLFLDSSTMGANGSSKLRLVQLLLTVLNGLAFSLDLLVFLCTFHFALFMSS